jgi:hypothetical chaperone protein
VFYRADTPARQLEAERLYGRAAIAAYVEGVEGRLMRSMKSLLGLSLLDQRTDVGGGRAVRYRDVVTGYLRELKARAEAEAGASLSRVVLGRPVFFVDDEPARDAQAQAALEAAAQAVGFTEVQFQYEPIAAALDHEATLQAERLVLVADIGGGTSDFSLVRVGPSRRGRIDRRDDILASHGVHRAGTDFDRHVELAAILPLMGYRTRRALRQALSQRAAQGVLVQPRAQRAQQRRCRGFRTRPTCAARCRSGRRCSGSSTCSCSCRPPRRSCSPTWASPAWRRCWMPSRQQACSQASSGCSSCWSL